MASSRTEERQLIAEICKKAQQYRKSAAEPEVGIFWFWRGQPVVDGTPVSESKSYGKMIMYTGDHAHFWYALQRNNLVPRDVEYDEIPRGRVVYDTASRTFTMYADRCILKDKGAVDRLKSAFGIPASTATSTDPHYRCPKCPGRAEW